jgi:Asp-tRNA(Asn)/Glu-tRNA(Gln) amidotransferase A subunit family amidase
MSEAVEEVKEVFREVLLHVLECEDELALELREPLLKETVRKHFENLRSHLTKVYVKSLRRRRERELKAFMGRLDMFLLPSRLIPKPSGGKDKAKAWIERLSALLDSYEEAVRRAREGRREVKEA